MHQFSLEYDRDYGLNHRSGWSVTIDGSVFTQFHRSPITAIIVALWRWWPVRSFLRP